MARSNREVVEDFITTSRTVSLTAALEKHASDDFIWWIPGTGEVQDRIVALSKIMRSHFVPGAASIEIHAITCQDDRVAIDSEARIPLKDGRVFHNHYHNLYRLRDGKIIQIREHHNSAHANPIWEPVFAAELPET